MRPNVNPVLNAVPLADLRPTQMTVGYREVKRKREAWAELRGTKRRDYLANHMVPTVLGPKGQRYLLDHHHLCRALMGDGSEGVFAFVVKDLSDVPKSHFWLVMEHHGWAHPYGADGEREDAAKMPRSIAEMADDPFRSLAGALRANGGFAKDVTPFSEFLWADFLRGRIKRRTVEDDFDKALLEAMKFARETKANYLPGWSPAGREPGSGSDA